MRPPRERGGHSRRRDAGPEHSHHGGPHPHHHRGRRGRAPRGDVRAAVLILLAEEPMHGYQLMHAIADRTGGRWTPSPGAIYPTLSQLEDEGLVTVARESGRKLATLTDAGRAVLEDETNPVTDPFAAFEGETPVVDLRDLMGQLAGAVRQVARAGTPEQQTAAATTIAEARKSIYLLLAEGPDASEDGPTAGE